MLIRHESHLDISMKCLFEVINCIWILCSCFRSVMLKSAYFVKRFYCWVFKNFITKRGIQQRKFYCSNSFYGTFNISISVGGHIYFLQLSMHWLNLILEFFIILPTPSKQRVCFPFFFLNVDFQVF